METSEQQGLCARRCYTATPAVPALRLCSPAFPLQPFGQKHLQQRLVRNVLLVRQDFEVLDHGNWQPQRNGSQCGLQVRKLAALGGLPIDELRRIVFGLELAFPVFRFELRHRAFLGIGHRHTFLHGHVGSGKRQRTAPPHPIRSFHSSTLSTVPNTDCCVTNVARCNSSAETRPAEFVKSSVPVASLRNSTV